MHALSRGPTRASNINGSFGMDRMLSSTAFAEVTCTQLEKVMVSSIPNFFFSTAWKTFMKALTWGWPTFNPRNWTESRWESDPFTGIGEVEPSLNPLIWSPQCSTIDSIDFILSPFIGNQHRGFAGCSMASPRKGWAFLGRASPELMWVCDRQIDHSTRQTLNQAKNSRKPSQAPTVQHYGKGNGICLVSVHNAPLSAAMNVQVLGPR